jgi:hypothetical protein
MIKLNYNLNKYTKNIINSSENKVKYLVKILQETDTTDFVLLVA